MNVSSSDAACAPAGLGLSSPATQREWFAVFTVPRSEKSVKKQLNLRDVECFLPTMKPCACGKTGITSTYKPRTCCRP